MPAKRRSLLDSFALLAFPNKERGFEKVKSLLRMDAVLVTGDPKLRQIEHLVPDRLALAFEPR